MRANSLFVVRSYISIELYIQASVKTYTHTNITSGRWELNSFDTFTIQTIHSYDSEPNIRRTLYTFLRIIHLLLGSLAFFRVIFDSEYMQWIASYIYIYQIHSQYTGKLCEPQMCSFRLLSIVFMQPIEIQLKPNHFSIEHVLRSNTWNYDCLSLRNC